MISFYSSVRLARGLSILLIFFSSKDKLFRFIDFSLSISCLIFIDLFPDFHHFFCHFESVLFPVSWNENFFSSKTGCLCSPDWLGTHWVDQAGPKLPEILVPLSWVLGLKEYPARASMRTSCRIQVSDAGNLAPTSLLSRRPTHFGKLVLFPFSFRSQYFYLPPGPLFLGVLYLSCLGPGCVECAAGVRGPCFLSFPWFYFPPLIALVSLKTPSWNEPDHPSLRAASWGWGAVLATVSIAAMKHYDQPGGLHF